MTKAAHDDQQSNEGGGVSRNWHLWFWKCSRSECALLGGLAGNRVISGIWQSGGAAEGQIVKRWKDELRFGEYVLRTNKDGQYCTIESAA